MARLNADLDSSTTSLGTGLGSRLPYVVVGVVAAAAALVATMFAAQAAVVPLRVAANLNASTAWLGHGAAPAAAHDTSVRPFRVNVSDAVLDELRARLRASRAMLPAPAPAHAWTYGADAAAVADLAQHWAGAFDWRAHEARLNRHAQFVTAIDGLDVHFVHVRADRAAYRVVHAALLLHGWPGSFVEFDKVVDGLVAPSDAALAFDVVVPSLPGFGFSQAPGQPGVSAFEVAVMLRTLMARLGYATFVVQGGDWGGILGALVAQTFPADVRGLHLNFFPTVGSPWTAPLRLLLAEVAPHWVLPDPRERALFLPFLSRHLPRIVKTLGYFYVQSTYPDTLAVGLSDSPIGLLAWIVEKFQLWSDCNGDVLTRFTRDELLTNVMIYWATNSIASSMRLYRESMHHPRFLHAVAHEAVTVPVGLIVTPRGYPGENAPRQWASYKYHHIVSYTIADAGGHFLAMEEPDILVDDFIRFVSKLDQEPAATAADARGSS